MYTFLVILVNKINCASSINTYIFAFANRKREKYKRKFIDICVNYIYDKCLEKNLLNCNVLNYVYFIFISVK